MIGMHIEATNTNLDINRDELEDARWFTRDEIRSAHIWSGNPIQSSASDHAVQSQVGISIPGPYAIAHHLIQHWLSNPRA
jgi:NAD+ diphosphatase